MLIKSLLAIMFGVIILSGCVGEPVVPVSDLTSPKSRYSARVVRSGDTLYLIAWESGLDYRQLASWNNLAPPYILEPGRRLRLTAGGQEQPSSASMSTGFQTSLNTVSSTNSKSNVLAEESVSNDLVTKLQDTGDNRVVKGWLWPVKGDVIQSFTGRNGNNGLDIAGEEGSPIRAAADGIVVYAGSGLRGYGYLLIIQHNEKFLSAYAHNRVLLVNEGATVEVGQIVAEMGSTDAESTRLHFEIRRDGKPVNPLKYLP